MSAGQLAPFTDALGVEVDPDLMVMALTHRSFAYENPGALQNERLEFLGDSVLGIVVTDALYHRHPDSDEGVLAKMRSQIVSSRALAEVGATLGLGSALQFDLARRAAERGYSSVIVGLISLGNRSRTLLGSTTVEGRREYALYELNP